MIRVYDSGMGALFHDVRYASRVLRRQPWFTATVVLTLAIGLGAATAALAVIDAAWLRPVPYPDPEQLVRIRIETPRPDGSVYAADPTLEHVRLWQGLRDVIMHVAATRSAGEVVILDDREPVRTTIFETHRITPQHLPLLGISPVIGRAFVDDDLRAGAADVALIGYDYWQRRYAGEPSMVGRTIRYRERSASADAVATIVGVLPRDYWRDAKLVLPLRETGQYQTVIARRRPGVGIDETRARLTEAAQALPAAPDMPAGPLRLTPLLEESALDRNPDQLRLLSIAAGIVLVLACVNVGALMLGRACSRQPELAVRASLGADRARLIQQVVVEGLLLSSLGAAAGLALAALVFEPLLMRLDGLLPTNAHPDHDPLVMAAAVALTLVAGVSIAAMPALRLSRVRVGAALARSAAHAAPLSRRGGQILIAGQIALTLIALAGAGLLIRSYVRMLMVDPGFDRSRIVTMQVRPVDDDDAVARAYYPALLDTLRAMPEVASAGMIDGLAARGAFRISVPGGTSEPFTQHRVSPGVFEALGVPLRDGRLPDGPDLAATPAGLVLSESAARSLFPDGAAAGRLLTTGKTTRPVLGVVADVNFAAPYPSERPDVYYVSNDIPAFVATVVVRPRASVPIAARLREAAHAVGPRVVVDGIFTGEETLLTNGYVAFRRERTILAAAPGAVGLLLAMIGVFGLTAYAVARRVREIGVRVAIGATPGAVVREAVADAMRPAALGVVLGLGGAALATRVLTSFLFETTPLDPVTFASAALVLGVAASLAAWLPARAAARVDPVAALRTE
jgi:predicted permease